MEERSVRSILIGELHVSTNGNVSRFALKEYGGNIQKEPVVLQWFQKPTLSRKEEGGKHNYGTSKQCYSLRGPEINFYECVKSI